MATGTGATPMKNAMWNRALSPQTRKRLLEDDINAAKTVVGVLFSAVVVGLVLCVITVSIIASSY